MDNLLLEALDINNSFAIENEEDVVTLQESKIGDMAYIKENNKAVHVYRLIDTDYTIKSNWEEFGINIPTGIGDRQTALTVDEKTKLDGIEPNANKYILPSDVVQDLNYKQPFHYDHAAQEYANLDKFWDDLKNGKKYTVEFNQFEVSPSSAGIKKDDNIGMICEPSTNTIRGRNDYENVGLFMSLDVNAYVDANDDYHVTAIKGDGIFKNDGTNGDVYVMAMAGYQKRFSNDDAWGISYSDTMYPGYEILDEAVKIDGTIKPYLLHAKYTAGRGLDGKLASISGVQAEYVDMSHNNQINLFKEKGTQYSGKTSHDDYYVNLMLWLKYATLNSQAVFGGCSNYYVTYNNLLAEMSVKRVVLTNAQGNYLIKGSTIEIASNTRYKITNIVDLGDGKSAVYVDAKEPFDTTLSTTISTKPWNSGGCDDVLGQDGSPYSNTSAKEPMLINGIEMMVGGYEILQNLIIYDNNADANNYKIEVYACYDCTKYATSQNQDYNLIAYNIAQTNESWKYISKIGIDPKNPSILVPIEAEASSTTGFGDALYTKKPETSARAWLSLGYVSSGAMNGFRCLKANGSLAASFWYFLGRLSATGRSQRRA